jgi:hypothetical protein
MSTTVFVWLSQGFNKLVFEQFKRALLLPLFVAAAVFFIQQE